MNFMVCERYLKKKKEKRIQTAHAAQYQKNKQPNPKMGGRPK